MDKVYGYVYCITNTVTSQLYVGRHKWSDPNSYDPAYYGGGKLIQSQVRTYGKAAFQVTVLARAATRDELISLEEQYIEEYQKQHPSKLLNVVRSGSSGFDTSLWSEDRRTSYLSDRSKYSKSTNSAAHFGRVDGEHNGRYGKPVSQTTRNKISSANRGRVQSSEERERRRVAHMTKCPDVHPPSMKGYIRMNNGTVNRWIHPDDVHKYSNWQLGWISNRSKEHVE